MSNLFKVSEAASLAIHGMILMAENPNKAISAKEIASTIHVSESHLAKVLQHLGKAGLVRSTRGPKGGFVLGKPAETITLLDIYEAIEGPLETITCLLAMPICGGGRHCCMGGLLQSVGEQVRRHLAESKLSHLTNGRADQPRADVSTYSGKSNERAQGPELRDLSGGTNDATAENHPN